MLLIIIVVIIIRSVIIVARTKAWALCGCRRGFCYGCYRSLGFGSFEFASSSEGSSIFSVGRSSMGMKSSSGSDKIGLSSITTFLTTLGVSVSKFNSGSAFFRLFLLCNRHEVRVWELFLPSWFCADASGLRFGVASSAFFERMQWFRTASGASQLPVLLLPQLLVVPWQLQLWLQLLP